MHFELYRILDGKYAWRLRADNTQAIAAGSGYASKADCLDAVGRVKGADAQTPIVDLTEDFIASPLRSNRFILV